MTDGWIDRQIDDREINGCGLSQNGREKHYSVIKISVCPFFT